MVSDVSDIVVPATAAAARPPALARREYPGPHGTSAHVLVDLGEVVVPEQYRGGDGARAEHMRKLLFQDLGLPASRVTTFYGASSRECVWEDTSRVRERGARQLHDECACCVSMAARALPFMHLRRGIYQRGLQNNSRRQCTS